GVVAGAVAAARRAGHLQVLELDVEGVPVREEGGEEVGRPRGVDAALDAGPEHLLGPHPDLGAVGGVRRTAGEEQEQPGRPHRPTSNWRSTVPTSSGFVPPAPVDGTTITRIPL